MGKIGYGDFLNFDGKDKEFARGFEELDKRYEVSIKSMIEITKELTKAISEALKAPKIDTGKLSQLVSETKAITRELNTTKTARTQLNQTKKRYIDLTNQEREAIAKDKIATQELRRETERIERLRISEINTLQRLRAQINLDAAALERMDLSTRKARREARRFSEQLRKKRDALREAEIAAGKLNANVGNYPKVFGIARRAVVQLAGAFGLYSGIQIAKNIFNEVKEIQSLNLALKTVTRTTAEYNASQLFLRDLAQRYGIEINSLTRDYTKFAASLKDTGINLSQGKELFDSVTKSAAVLGASTEDTQGALRALGQILSKGKLQAEELRGQLGDRLPGVMQIVADVTGKTTAELEKMLQRGELLAIDVLPKLAKGFENAYNTKRIDTVETLTAKQTRLTNAWKLLIRTIDEGQGPISKVFGFLSDKLTGALSSITEVNERFTQFKEIFGESFTFQISENIFNTDERTKLNSALNGINEEFQRLSKDATGPKGIGAIEKRIEYLRELVDNTEFDNGFESKKATIFLFQIERLTKLLNEAKEAEKERAKEAAKVNEQAEKTHRDEVIAKVAERERKKIEDARLPVMEKISQEQKFQADLTKDSNLLYTEQEQKILAINQALAAGTLSAEQSKEKAEELLNILAQQEREKQIKELRDDFSKAINFIDQLDQNAYERKLRRLENETAATNRLVTSQEERARLGLRNQLAFEERELAKQELRKERLQQRRERRQRIQTFYNTFNSLLESGRNPLIALGEAGAITLTGETYAASLRDGGIAIDAVNAQNGTSKYGRFDRGYLSGVSHENKKGGIPMLLEGSEGVISKKGMRGYDSPEQFKQYHEFLRNGGKHNDLLKGSVKSIISIEKTGDNKEMIDELRGIKSRLENIQPQEINGDLLGQLPQLAAKINMQGKIIEKIIQGGYSNSKGITNNRRGYQG